MTEDQAKACGLPPRERTIIAPEGGWEPRTYYVVEVASRPTNPIHRAIFYSGFLNKGEPAGYNAIWNATYEVGDQYPISKCHYLKVIAQIEGIRWVATFKGRW